MDQHRPAPASICGATRKDGTPCTLRAGADGYCFAHGPRAAEARRKGGEGKATHRRLLKRAPEELRSLTERLLVAVEEVHRGHLDPRRAHAMAALARALVAVVQEAELMARIEALEERLDGGAPWSEFGD